MIELPERINAIRTVTYSVPDIVAYLKEMGEEYIDLEDIMEYVEDNVAGDMSYPPSRHDLVYQDENGDEL